jgi:hypothetical protein
MTVYMLNTTESKEMDGANERIAEAVGLLNHFWLTTLSDASLKEKARLKYVSHMWDNNRPYWYLWYNDCSGVHKMELHKAETAEGYDWLAEFAVKYYPSETESAFNGLSTLEKLCRKSEMFHNLPTDGECGCPCHGQSHTGQDNRFPDLSKSTGAPSFKYSEIIPADFFCVGNMLTAFNAHKGSLVRLKSQTNWRITLTEDFALADDNGDILAVLKKGEVDKDYPCYAISYSLYHRFIKTWALVHNYKCQQESLWKTDGLTFNSDGYSVTPKPSSEIQKIIVQSELKFKQEEYLAPLPDEDISLVVKCA